MNPSGWRERWARAMPSVDKLAATPWLRPIAHRLADPMLWHRRTESIARGAAIGLFWAFALPFAQILAATAHCVWWRANIPVAAAITFVTNPLTLGGWLVLAYQVGSLILPGGPPPTLQADGLLAMARAFGTPTLLGMALFALGGAAFGYLAVRIGSRLWFHWRLASRGRRLAARRSAVR